MKEDSITSKQKQPFAMTPRQKQPAAMTPRQKKAALVKKQRQNWRRQVQNQVNKNEIPNPCHCGFVVFDLEGAGFLEEDITEIAAIRWTVFLLLSVTVS